MDSTSAGQTQTQDRSCQQPWCVTPLAMLAEEPPALTEPPDVDDVTPAIAGQPSAIGPDDEDGACAGEEGKVIHIESENEDAEADVEVVDNRVPFTPFTPCTMSVEYGSPLGGHHLQTPVQSSGDWGAAALPTGAHRLGRSHCGRGVTSQPSKRIACL